MNMLDSFADVKLNFIGQIALAFLIFGIVLYIFNILFGYTKRFIKSYKGTVDIYDSLKNAETKLVISNNPKDSRSYVNIPRSYNEENGVEFTYQFWMLMEDFKTRDKQYKHLFHKGNEILTNDDSPIGPDDFKIPLLNAPGAYIDKDKNQLIVVMNTFKSPGRKVDDKSDYNTEDQALIVPNIPINKWILISIILEGQQLTVYKNGYLKTSKLLEGYPRQNNSPIYINDMNGFRGFMSRIKYYNYAVPQSEIQSYVNDGPGTSACLKNKDVPKYMSNTNTYVETNI